MLTYRDSNKQELDIVLNDPKAVGILPDGCKLEFHESEFIRYISFFYMDVFIGVGRIVQITPFEMELHENVLDVGKVFLRDIEKILTNECFKNEKVLRVCCYVPEYNKTICNTLYKCGFVLEGYKHQAGILNGEYVGCFILGKYKNGICN